MAFNELPDGEIRTFDELMAHGDVLVRALEKHHMDAIETYMAVPGGVENDKAVAAMTIYASQIAATTMLLTAVRQSALDLAGQ